MQSELASSLQQLPTVKVQSTILWEEKGVTNFLLSQTNLSGSVDHLCQCFKRWDLSSCSSFGKCLFYTCRLRNVELQIHETRSQVKKFSAFLHMGRLRSQGSLKLFPWYVPQPSGACNPAFWVSLGFTVGSGWSGHSLMTARWQVFPFLWAHWLTLKGCNRWFHSSGVPFLVMGVVKGFLEPPSGPVKTSFGNQWQIFFPPPFPKRIG